MNDSKHDKAKTITIKVNETDVQMPDRVVTGAEIKAAAIAQGVQIEPNFILHRELPNGREEIVGDDDEIKLRPHDSFTALARDDNS